MHPFASRRSDSVAALGESGLIIAIRRWLGSATPPPPFGIGDDCAVVPASRGRQLLKVDPVIYTRHFDAKVPPRAAGAKLLKRNLSDIAAMGGCPGSAVVALLLDPHVSVTWLEQFHRGLAACARRYGVAIVGGAVGQAPGTLSASLTLLGRAPTRLLTRRGAGAGDRIYVTGVLGNSLASGHHLSFRPRLAEGAWCARQPAVRAMMDISDGLAKDLPALTPGGVEAAVLAASLPLRAGADVRAAVSDGEDHELLLAVDGRREPARFAAAWKRAFPRTRLTCIGRFVPRGQMPPEALRLSDYHGFEHLRA
jgi:thiamine-monophosphate kinase